MTNKGHITCAIASVFVLTGSMLLSSCRPISVLSSGEMVAVLTDLHRMDGILQVTGIQRDPDSDEPAYYDAVLASHGLTRAEFDSSLVWYTHHPQRFNKIYPKVLKNLEDEHALFEDESAQQNAIRAERKQHFTLFTFECVVQSLREGYPIKDYRIPPPDTLHVQIPMIE